MLGQLNNIKPLVVVGRKVSMDVFLESSKNTTHIYWENELGESCGYTFEFPEEDQPMTEA